MRNQPNTQSLHGSCRSPPRVVFVEVVNGSASHQETNEETGQLLYCGLRASIGFCYGWANFQKLLVNTGRADCFGNLPNRAARLMGVAMPGQVWKRRLAPPPPLRILGPIDVDQSASADVSRCR
jgi:hypothetical protein